VSWDEAARYLNWLSLQESLTPVYTAQNGVMLPATTIGTGFRFPTEIEWAYVARYDGQRSTPLKYSWGNAMPPTTRSGNFADNSAKGTAFITINGYSDGFAVSSPVGTFPPNEAGIYDLAGNVAEWCHDYYDLNLNMEDMVRNDSMGPITGTFHVVRGASWRHGGITELRLSYRDYAEKPRIDLGFRIARYADEVK